MEHDQVLDNSNPGTNHATILGGTVEKGSETQPIASKALPPSAAPEGSTAKVSEISSVEASTVISTKNEDIINQKAGASTDGETSSQPLSSYSRPLSASTTAYRQEFSPPAAQTVNKPLAPSRLVETARGGSSHNSNLMQTPLSKASPTTLSAFSLSKTSTSESSADQSPIVTDEHNVQDEKLKQQRKPLTDKYGSYICPADTSLDEARLRLHTAMEQTRMLRQSFTDRVYKKYRLCLEPIPTTQESLTKVLSDPQGRLVHLEYRIQQLTEEKAAEKREAAALNTEMTQAPEKEKVERITNAENAEQLMYISAGLSLIILPEDETDDISKWYTDRGPMHPTTGQRVKGISPAAATAGEVMLDRKRKGVLLRKERLNQHHAKGANSSEYSRLQLLARNPTAPINLPSQRVTAIATDNDRKPGATTTSTVGLGAIQMVEQARPIGSKPGAPQKSTNKTTTGGGTNAATAKAIRARVQATMSVQTLLSLSPTGEELRTDGKLSAATMALMECGIGTLPSKSHPRYRHPYPESAGGRRRALHGGSSAAAAKESASLAWSLPPLPTVKERRCRKRLSTPTQGGGSTHALEAIRKVLTEFDNDGSGKRQKLSEISFLHGIQDFGLKSQANSAATSPMVDPRRPAPKIDPTLAFHVMRAVGLIQSAESDKESPVIFPTNLDQSMFPVAERRAMGDEGGVSRRSISKLRALHEKFLSRKETFSHEILQSRSQVEITLHGKDQLTAVAIRGGGEALNESVADKEDEDVGQHNIAGGTNISINGAANKSSLPMQRTNQGLGHSPQANIWNDQPRLVLLNGGSNPGNQPMTRIGHYPNVDRYYPNAVQLANQLRLSRMPNQGARVQSDLSEYLGSLHPQAASGYDWSAVNAASAVAAASAQSLAALGIAPHRASLVNFPLQDRARALRHDPSAAAAAAAAHHHQQALVYLSGGYQNAGGARFQQNLGATMMNPVYANQPELHVQMRQQQDHSRSQPRGQQPRPDAKAIIGASTKDDTKEKDSQPECPAAGSGTSTETSSAGVKRKVSNGDSLETEPLKRAKVIGPSGESVPSNPPPDSTITTASVSNTAIPITASTANGTAATQRSPSEKPVTPFSILPLQVPKTSHGLQFFVPIAPAEVPTDVASKILEARSHEAAGKVNSLGRSEKSAVVAYLVAVGSAVPIPKTLVANLFKEKLHASPLKGTSLSGIPQSSRDAAVATILLWLWESHEDCFQRAFAKSGRIDVEPECKWLLSAAVDRAILSLGQAMDDPTSRTTTPLAIALMAIKSKTSNQKGSHDKDSSNFVTSSLDLLVVSAISKGLSSGFMLSRQIDALLPNFNDLLDYVDELRKCALYSKSQERALLAALISRKATMSLSFSHAYVSAMVRAGEALGHGELFEVIQNEEVNVSTMIPYDVFTDESGAWEDPCRPATGFNANLTGDDLMRQAHARAMIQKSLRKLQERHNVKGGTVISGAYIDPPAPRSASDVKSAASSVTATPRVSHKRRPSFAEKPVQVGTGSAAATSWLLYEPKHTCAPLDWNAESVENAPYGKHDTTTVPRSLSVSQFSMKVPGRGRGRNPETSIKAFSEQIKDPEPDEGPVKRSTREIPWVEVADIFQNVNLPGTPRLSDMSITPKGRTIFAPSIRQVAFDDIDGSIVDESDDDEDFRDEIVLARHQKVLDNMKEHLSDFFAAREKNSQEKRGRKSSKA